jgi:hypothetical protein
VSILIEKGDHMSIRIKVYVESDFNLYQHNQEQILPARSKSPLISNNS